MNLRSLACHLNSPPLSPKEMLALTPEEFEKVAKDANTNPEKLKEILGREIQRQAERQPSFATTPPSAVLEENQQKVRVAFEEVVGDFDFLSKEYTKEGVEQLHEIADTRVRKVQKEHGDFRWPLNEERIVERMYTKAYLGEAMVHILSALRKGDIPNACRQAITYLDKKMKNINLDPEKKGIQMAIQMFQMRLWHDTDFQNLNDLYRAYKNDSMTHEQKLALARLLNKAKSAAMTEVVRVREKDSHLLDSLVPMLARAIRAAGVYSKTADGVSGPAEVFGMPGNRGTGAGDRYWRGPRPHRDDYNSSGNRDDK